MASTDKELIEATLCGDVSAFETLYRRHWRLAVGVALGTCADRHLAEDAAQESFAIIAAQLDSLRDHERFGQWLCTVCRRTASRMRRHHRLEHTLEFDPPMNVKGESANVRALTLAMLQLDDETRELLVMRYFSSCSHEEIATALDITLATVHGRLQRGRKKLADIVSRVDQEI